MSLPGGDNPQSLTLILCSLDRFRGMVDVYNYIIRVVNILTYIFLIIRARKITVISSHQFQQMAARLDTKKIAP